MAVENCINQTFFDNDDDDDDGPVRFKRNKSASKQNQSSPALKKSSLQKHAGSSGSRISNVCADDVQRSNMQKDKLASTAKVSIERCTNSSSKSRVPMLDQSKHNLTTNHADKMHPNSSRFKGDDSDDCDDDKPSSSRPSSDSAKIQNLNSLHVMKEHNDSLRRGPSTTKMTKTSTILEKSSEDSEDEKSSKFSLKSSIDASTRKLHESDQEKPLASTLQQNGSHKQDLSSELISTKVLNKRPLNDTRNPIQSPSMKRAKLSNVSVSGKSKPDSVVKKEQKMDDDNHISVSQRMKKVSSDNPSSLKRVITKPTSSFKRKDKMKKKPVKNSKYSKSIKVLPGSGEGQKWTTLQHNGAIFPPPYKPHGVKMLYNGQPVDLTPGQEEVATMFAVMKDTEYATKQRFIQNFMNDWRVVLGKKHVIKKFELCDFTPIYEWHLNEKEKKKQMSSEEKKALREEKLKQEEKYMWGTVDSVKEKVGNFRVEPPGLFRGRGEHPKMGKLKRRIRPSDITINIGKDALIPECPIPGERWKEIKHDNSVTWLAFWTDPINPKEFKYVFLAASSSLKGQSDKEKYEKARLLKEYVDGIRLNYTKDFKSKDITKRQIAVATYLIDKLALRAGNEKDEDEADTVGCCTLKVENVTLLPPNKLQFDFLGKDSIRYFNTVEVELTVYEAIGVFRKGKNNDEDLFDKLDTSKLNAHLKELMPGLTAKVFRTYNASITLDLMNRGSKDGTVPEKIAVYQHANKEVAIICNHQRSVSKSHDAQMSRLNEKIADLKAQREEMEVDLSKARKGMPPLKDAEGKTKKNLSPEVLERKLEQIHAKIEKMELDKKIKEDLKAVALGTSKINYLDPRISVAWCKCHEVPIEKIFNKSLLAKFTWAMDVDPSFRF